MEETDKNNFDKRGGELMPRELMERAASMFADTAYTVNLILTVVILQMESSGRGGKRAGGAGLGGQGKRAKKTGRRAGQSARQRNKSEKICGGHNRRRRSIQ